MTSALSLVCRLGAALCFLDALLIIGSALSRGNAQTVVVSVVVGFAYVAVAIIVLALGRACRRIAAEEAVLRGQINTTGLRHATRMLAGWLLVAPIAAATIAAASLLAIYQRLSEGFAVFG
ncbi:hypothetical protein ACVDG3_20730 [Meridianimarinicoccus sp. RP-17]|uniref:hypothetical protein n=1 Tax=Meridianimarinicoccus zhengii TaxID=2056810 RepID=UPI0013A6AC93|nr:hypothetical protein [Phycocomes zhengii]